MEIGERTKPFFDRDGRQKAPPHVVRIPSEYENTANYGVVSR
jgi:hypothetical protein